MQNDRFNSNEDFKWHKEAYSQGIQARLNGFKMNNKCANPYMIPELPKWLYRSFCAGWADADMDVIRGNVDGEDTK